MQAVALLMCHTHYPLTKLETPGLIDDTIANQEFKKTCYGCILIEIFNNYLLLDCVFSKIDDHQILQVDMLICV